MKHNRFGSTCTKYKLTKSDVHVYEKLKKMKYLLNMNKKIYNMVLYNMMKFSWLDNEERQCQKRYKNLTQDINLTQVPVHVL